MATQPDREYAMKCQRVYNPCGLAKYLTSDAEIRKVVACSNITGQKTMLKQLTTKQPIDYESGRDEFIERRTVRGKKYEFVKKMMKCNSTDLGDVIVYCKNSTKKQYAKQWNEFFKNTANVKTIIAAEATDVNIECKVPPIWEQIADKREFFTRDKNRYWSIVQSLNILEEWCTHHRFDIEKFAKDTFEVCHKIMSKINSLHITGVSNLGKSYVLRSIRNGLMNCGRMRCQVSDNFTFGSCVDKTLVYTDEMHPRRDGDICQRETSKREAAKKNAVHLNQQQRAVESGTTRERSNT